MLQLHFNRFWQKKFLIKSLCHVWKFSGFKTASTACCGNGGRFAGIIPCGPTSSMCENRSEYVFWDPYHPSEAANLIIAKKLVDGETKYISPMNLRTLRNLWNCVPKLIRDNNLLILVELCQLWSFLHRRAIMKQNMSV